MKASVVIPAYGNEEALSKSLATLRAQTMKPHEIIVVDDGSPWALNVPKSVRLERIERLPSHRGSSAAKNYGAQLATGDLLVFADSDILHLPDAIESLVDAYSDWGSDTLLLNTSRVGLPERYPDTWMESLETLLHNCELAGIAIDPDMERSVCCWEQNCGAISARYFWHLGGYDAEGFPSWGYNNQDLVLRVILDGGAVSSAIPRASTGRRLQCFHLWHDAPRGEEQAHAEFIAKWGERFSQTLVDTMRAQRRLGRFDEYRERIYRRAA